MGFSILSLRKSCANPGELVTLSVGVFLHIVDIQQDRVALLDTSYSC